MRIHSLSCLVAGSDSIPSRHRALLLAPCVLALAVSLAISMAPTAHAQTITNDFLVQHDFTLVPGGSIVPTVTAVHYLQGYVLSNPPSCSHSDVLPAAQPAGFSPLAPSVSEPAASGALRVINYPDIVEANLATNSVPSTGFSSLFSVTAQGLCTTALATATAEFEIDPFTAGGQVTGTIKSYGMSQAVRVPGMASESYAIGMAAIEVQGGNQLLNGTIDWLPTLRDVVADSTNAGTNRDPISFSVENLNTGQTTQGTLLSIVADLDPNHFAGEFRWYDGLLEIGAGKVGSFEIDKSSSLLANPGQLYLEFDGVQITVANATGDYAGTLPPVGTLLPTTIFLTSEQTLEYDLGDFSGDPVLVTMHMGGSAQNSAPDGYAPTAAPEPSTPTLDTFDLAIHPNPFNPSTSVSFNLDRQAHVDLGVFDVKGRRLRTLVDRELAAQRYELQWDGRDDDDRALASGVYYLRLRVNDSIEVQRVAMVR